MDLQSLQQIVLAGEDSQQQFKRDVSNADALAAEMVAMANTDGGRILIGVSDAGELHGLSSKDVGRINQLISNTASQHVRSPLSVQTENVLLENGQVVIVLTIPVGIDKPYFDKNGVIWLKSGADKRRIQSKEELRRLFQSVDAMHADEIPTKTGVQQCQSASNFDPPSASKIDPPLFAKKLCSVLEPPTPISSLDDVAMMGNAIKHCRCHFGVAEDL